MEKKLRLLKIDEEFKTIIRPLKRKEFVQLDENIKADGCRDPIITWNGIIVDGHNRYEICSKNAIPFEVMEMDFSCREEAIAWICKNQLGRRNLSDESRRYLIGRQYESEKIVNASKNPTGNNQYTIPPEDDLPADFNVVESASRHKTAQRIANENHITHATVHKYSTFTKAIDIIKSHEPDLAHKILSGRYKISHENIIAISKLSPAEMKKIHQRIKENSVPFVQYKRTRYLLDETSAQPNPQPVVSKPSIKDMPKFDPDASLNELSLTIPMWISSINRMKTNTKIDLTSTEARAKLMRVLQELENKIVEVLYFLASESRK